jgi:hypothetical protein
MLLKKWLGLERGFLVDDVSVSLVSIIGMLTTMFSQRKTPEAKVFHCLCSMQ